jgi:Holliday junction resolvasome RuvABC endonuclease subunit
MTILALDLATKTGWACRATPVNAPILYGTWNFKGSRYEGGGMRFLRFQSKLDEVHQLSRLHRIVYEEVRRHIGTDAAHIYGGLMGILTSWCELNNIPYEGVPVGTIKKHATGRGNSNKEAMIAAMRAKGFAPTDDNDADALALLLCVIEEGIKT